jgi:hypothetical protein
MAKTGEHKSERPVAGRLGRCGMAAKFMMIRPSAHAPPCSVNCPYNITPDQDDLRDIVVN